MGLLQVSVQVGVLLAQIYLSQATTRSPPNCGVIFPDYTELDVDDYVCENIHTADFQSFVQRMYNALHTHWVAYTFIKSFPGISDPPEETGSPVCPTENKHILGYFKNHGLTLCLVVYPYVQLVKKAECCSEESPCGPNTKCVPGGFVRRKYLVYCDALYTDDNGCLIGTDELSDTTPDYIDEADFNPPLAPNRKKRNADYDGSTPNDREKRGGCPNNEYYFAFRHDYLPSTCVGRKCNCG